MPAMAPQITIQPIFEYGTPMASSMPWTGKRRHGVDLGIAHLANLAAGFDQVLRLGELAHDGVDFVVADAQLVFDLSDENGGIRAGSSV